MDISFLTKNKKKIIIVIIIISIILIGQSLLNSTYSLFYHEDIASNADSYSTGLLSITADAAGDNISLENTLPISDTEGAATTAYTFTIKNIGNLDYKFNVKLLSTGDSTTTIDSQYIKIKVDDGSVTTLSSLSNSIIKKDITLSAGQSIDISIRVWLSINTPNTQIGKVFNSKIVTDGQAVYTNVNDKTYSNYTGFAKVIANQFSPNEEVTNNNVIYKYDTVNNLMEDVGYNIRYYGASPNNYIYFNCADYSNQTSDTCEIWRIIGVFNGKVKIMRNKSIGRYVWDTSDSTINQGYGINDWSQAKLMRLLNPSKYYNGKHSPNNYGEGLYYNREDGKCFNSQNDAIIFCNFASIGLKNDTTRNMISENIYYLGPSSTVKYSDYIYNIEKTSFSEINSDGSIKSNTWYGKVAIPYASDYGYAADFRNCSVQTYYYKNCRQYNWMSLLISDDYGWLLTNTKNVSTDINDVVFLIASSGSVTTNFCARQSYVNPSVYLNPELSTKSGDGSSSNPYQLSI